MPTETTPAPVTIAPFDPAKTKAEIQLSLSKEGLQYQKILQEGELVVFTKDKLAEDQPVLKTLRTVKSKLEKIENPYTDLWKGFNEARKSLVDPIVDLLARKETEYRKLVKEVQEENDRIEKENQRKAGIQQAINEFFLTQSQAIAACKTTPELVAIEKLIGSHRANKSRYQEFLDDLGKKADELTPIIKKQKEAIKQLEDLKRQEEEALKLGNDQDVLDLRDKQEAVQQAVEENKVVVQETAINQVTNTQEVVSPPVMSTAAPKARRTVWKAEIVDLREAMKKAPSMLDCTLNPGKVKEVLGLLKENQQLEGKTELTMNGIRYYEDKSY